MQRLVLCNSNPGLALKIAKEFNARTTHVNLHPHFQHVGS